MFKSLRIELNNGELRTYSNVKNYSIKEGVLSVIFAAGNKINFPINNISTYYELDGDNNSMEENSSATGKKKQQYLHD